LVVPAFAQVDFIVELPMKVTVLPISWVQPLVVAEFPLYWMAAPTA